MFECIVHKYTVYKMHSVYSASFGTQFIGNMLWSNLKHDCELLYIYLIVHAQNVTLLNIFKT